MDEETNASENQVPEMEARPDREPEGEVDEEFDFHRVSASNDGWRQQG